MSSLVVAKFDNQFAATSAFDKLMSRGLRRREGVVQCDESIGRSAASSSAPTSVISHVSHRGKREGERRALRTPAEQPNPRAFGAAILVVEIHDDRALDEVMDVMRGMHALDVHVLPGKTLEENDAPTWPEPDMGMEDEVDRAIDAALRGRPRVH
jgi:hypothetical protein